MCVVVIQNDNAVAPVLVRAVNAITVVLFAVMDFEEEAMQLLLGSDSEDGAPDDLGVPEYPTQDELYYCPGDDPGDDPGDEDDGSLL